MEIREIVVDISPYVGILPNFLPHDASAVYAVVVCLSCLSVHHMPVLCHNRSTEDHTNHLGTWHTLQMSPWWLAVQAVTTNLLIFGI